MRIAVRSGPWKLYHNGGQTELYHLDNDLGERQDLSKEKPKLVERLSAAWAAWEVDVNNSAQQYER